jgi:hypothetical protein
MATRETDVLERGPLDDGSVGAADYPRPAVATELTS